MNIKIRLKYLLNYHRKIRYIIRGSKVAFECLIRYNVSLRKCKIGKFCYIGENSGLNRVSMGNYCSIATNVLIGNMEHSVDDYSTSPRLSDSGDAETETIIGNDVWIGAQAFIKQGVIIGDGAVIGAQTFVNKNVPPYAIVVGTPGRILRIRLDEKTRTKLIKSEYWNFNPTKAKLLLEIIKKESFTN